GGGGLGGLSGGAELGDLLWRTLVVLGIEEVRIQPGITVVTPLDFVSYPYSHSLLMLVVWGGAFGGIYLALRGGRQTVALVLELLVVSHWVLDWITHRPDLPVTPTGSARAGLGLWNSAAGTLAAECALLGFGVGVFLGATRARTRGGTIGLWSLVAFLVIVYLASAFGPPPPSAAAVAWSAQAMWLLVAWGYWVDRSRSADGHARSAG